jgi:hypothetical protein
MAILLAIHMSDHLLNAMINPVFMIALGGISAIGPSIRKMYNAQKRAAAQGAAAQNAAYNAGYTPGATYPVGYAGFPELTPTPTVRAAGAAWRA